MPRRALDSATIVDLTRQAAGLGFTDVGITGGEPFLNPDLPAVLAEVASILPTVVLSSGTLFNDVRLVALRPLAGLPIRIQISLVPTSPRSTTRHGARTTSPRS